MNIPRKFTFVVSILLALLSCPAAFADYLWPLPFGNELTSIFGDYRNRRYHVGIDMRTGGEIGKTVVAPMDGYVMRVRTGYFGYGKAIYFKMADDNVAVFGHLSAFEPKIEQYIRQRQIASESYNQEVDLSADKFPFKRGETIAFSGATGVGAPHLHFEVRTPDNVPLNPLTFDGLRLEDKTTPVFRNLRLVGFGNEELARALGWDLSYTLRKTSGKPEYSIGISLPCGLDDFWLAAEIVDKVGKSMANKPIYDIEVRCLDRVLYHLRYDKVPFEETYLIDAQRNHQMAKSGNEEYYNLVDVATARRYTGLCELVGIDQPPIEIIASDVAGNSARATVQLSDVSRSSKDDKFSKPKPDTTRLNGLLNKYGDYYGPNRAAWIPAGDKLYLLVKLQSPKPAKVAAIKLGSDLIKPLDQISGRFYLGIADEVSDTLGASIIDTDSVHVLIEPAVGESSWFEVPVAYLRIQSDPDEPSKLMSDDGQLSVEFPKGDIMFPLDDNYYYQVNRAGAGTYRSYSLTPSNTPFSKQLTYTYSLGDKIPKGVGLYSVVGSGLFYLGGTIDSTRKSISAKSYVLAMITARQDTIPPSVRQLRPAAGAYIGNPRPQVSFAFADDLSGVSDYIDIRIDGQWIIPIYDPETGGVTAVPHFDLTKGKHKLEVKVSDKAGNIRRTATEFTRSGK
ncbi:MAG: M23 family metallopeptidase [Candidatus Zixiibacteriota bacterium]